MTKVPLTIYRGTERIIIGEANVDIVGEEAIVTGEIKDESYKYLVRDQTLKDIGLDTSVCFKDSEPFEATIVPMPKIPTNPAFQARINLKDIKNDD